jgi:hypothetical protein
MEVLNNSDTALPIPEDEGDTTLTNITVLLGEERFVSSLAKTKNIDLFRAIKISRSSSKKYQVFC